MSDEPSHAAHCGSRFFVLAIPAWIVPGLWIKGTTATASWVFWAKSQDLIPHVAAAASSLEYLVHSGIHQLK